MNEKKYFIYLDILGFEELAKKMAKKTGFEEDKLRQDYLSDPLEKKIEEMKREGIQISKGISEIEGSDDYVLVVDDIQTAFESVGKLTTIKILHSDYGFIPLEVALGTKKIDVGIEVKLINRKEIIKFLKDDVINPYRSYYKNNNDETIKETFVLFAQEFFDDLEPLDKKYCERISHRNKTFFVADLEKIQQRARVFEFLEKIGYSGSKWYGRIDEVYVPPSEYKEMAKTLHEKKILFITGTPEYGKTYTAVRLMWEFYNRGYEPRWILGGESAERNEVRRRLEDIGAVLKPGRIIYFEDPFGKTRDEGREGLEREIGTIVDNVRQVEDVYVIITSREEIFKEFEKEKLSAAELQEFERKLNIKNPSYDYEKRKEILLKWTGEKNCKWLGTKKLKGLVLESMKDATTLPTPLSIKNFAVATSNIEKEDELKEKRKEKSMETARAFAEEIKNMTDDKILFLSFPFIYDYYEVDFVRTMYQELVDELNLKDAWGFDRVLDWFKDDKVDSSGNHIQFSHPSYSETLEHLLAENGHTTRMNREIFSKLLLKLSGKDSNHHVAWVVAHNFDKLPTNVRNLLFKLSEKHEAASAVAEAVIVNFDKLPEDARNLLFKLSEKNETSSAVAWNILVYFDELPEDVRNKLLLKLSEKDGAALDVAWIIVENFYKLPEDVRNLLFKLSEKNETSSAVAEAVVENFDTLPEDVRNLLFKLSEKDNAAWAIAFSVACNFDGFHEDVRNLLFKLSEKDETSECVASAVAYYFDKLPEDVRNLLFKLSEKDETSEGVAFAVACCFDKLPEDVRNLLFKLSEKDETSEGVASAVAYYFDKLPEDVRNLLDRLQKPLQQVIKDLSRKDCPVALRLISNGLPKIDQDFALKVLNEFSKSEDEEVRTEAVKLLKTMMEDATQSNSRTNPQLLKTGE